MASLRATSPVKPDYDNLSSPDPLASLSNDASSVRKSIRKSQNDSTDSVGKTRRHRAAKSNSIDLSPSKTVTEQTLSPWRIRVTVEAEPEDEYENMHNHMVTKTIKIPLRDASSPSRSTPGRLRNSQTSAVKKTRRRSMTPDRAGRGSRRSLTDLEAIVLGDDQDEDEWTGRNKSSKRGKSRSRSRSKSNTGSQATQKQPQPADFAIREDAGADVMPASTSQDQSQELREIDPNRVSMRPRGASIRKKDLSEPTGKLKSSETLDYARKASVNSAKSYPTPSPTGSEAGNSEPHNAEEDMNPAYDDDEPFDSFMESEGFTMIDLDSIPSIKQVRSSPAEQPDQRLQPSSPDGSPHFSEGQPNRKEAKYDTAVSYPDLSTQESTIESSYPSSPPETDHVKPRSKPYSIGHLQIPSSTHVYRHRQITPQIQSPPSLPSPPRPAVAKSRSSPHSNKALKAGIILQDALTPTASEEKNWEQAKTQSFQETAVFTGFDASTRRELRAGLRFGEELAKRNSPFDQEQPQQQPQTWRGESVVQHTPVSVPTRTETHSANSKEPNLELQRESKALYEEYSEDSALLKEQCWQRERDAVIEQAKKAEDHLIYDSSEGDQGNNHDTADDNVGNETEGDIWLAEANNTSSSAEEDRVTLQTKWTESERKQRERAKELLEKPKRKLIPSAWKRGEQIPAEENNTSSLLSADASMTGLLWKDAENASTYKFGAEIISNPYAAQRQHFQFDRRRSGELDSDHTIRQTQRLSPRSELDNHTEDGVDPSRNDGQLEWRNAEEVVEEETNQLESEREADSIIPDDGNDKDVLSTKLHETSLEDVPEQDLSSSPQRLPVRFDDGSTITEDSDLVQYRQRTSLSPSKERPNTPRSALKGGRLSFGAGLGESSDEMNGKKVIWAKRSSCMNEDWEESTRSIRSGTESAYEDTITSNEAGENQQDVPATSKNQPLVIDDSSSNRQAQNPKKGWFGWLCKSEPTALLTTDRLAEVPNLDGTSETAEVSENIANGDEQGSQASRRPTLKSENSSRFSALTAQDKIPSYLLPPSYPSDPSRDTSVPLSTSGEFENTHFRTLHIIYRKSVKAQDSFSPSRGSGKKFRGPSYPKDIRHDIRQLVENEWELNVDESRQMGEVFTFKIGEEEARVLERFCREVEHGYGGKAVTWGWKMEQLAIWLGRVAVGEVVRERERDSRIRNETGQRSR